MLKYKLAKQAICNCRKCEVNYGCCSGSVEILLSPATESQNEERTRKPATYSQRNEVDTLDDGNNSIIIIIALTSVLHHAMSAKFTFTH